MHLDQLIIGDDDDGITDRHQIIFKFIFLFFRKRLVEQNDKLGTIAEFDLFFRLLGNAGDFSRRSCGNEGAVIDLLSVVSVDSPAKDLHKSLSARIDNAGFFQYRKQFGCTFECFFGACKYLIEKCVQILCRFAQLGCLCGRFARDSQNCSLFRLHDRFICGLHSFTESLCDDHRVKLFCTFDSPGKSSEQL